MQIAASLDILRFPLWGSQLIEASAGTGKTHTIALLYVRLVLEHAGPNNTLRPGRVPEDILVVTFTDAATQELRSRIRKNLALAERCFGQRMLPTDSGPEAVWMQQWRAEFSQDHWPMHAQALARAAQSMDAAAISTIHGWCHRMLREHAFDSQTLFHQVLQTDGLSQRRQAVRDYWRRFYDPLPAPAMARIASFWKNPAALESALSRLMPYADSLAQSPVPEQANLEAVLQAHDAAVLSQLGPLKRQWAIWVIELRDLFAQADARNAFYRQRFQKPRYSGWLQAIADWADNPSATVLELNAGWDRLTPQGLAEVWREASPPDHPALQQTKALERTLDAVLGPKTVLLRHALNWVATACQMRRRAQTELNFDDMLRDLALALQSETGPALADAIRAQFPVALIDEFQDTDPVQYEIVDRVYGVAQSRPETTLVLIGDPKQAIYSFRQADIYTYLRARRDIQGRIYTLANNYRSTTEMVNAVNALFSRAEARTTGKGAFHFRKAGDNPVPFLPVEARPGSVKLEYEGQAGGPVQWIVHAPTGGVTKDQYLHDLAQACADQVATWLNLSDAGKMCFHDPQTGARTALAPRHIAVLVDNGWQAQLVRKALGHRGLRSVYLSDKESVYDTPQAEDVYRLLQACAYPENESLVRAALATAALGVEIPALSRLTQDELAWESCLEQFKAYRQIWRQRGVLPMLRRLLLDYQVAQRLLTAAEDQQGQTGERILADLLHLAEVLQQASVRLEGPDALLRYFAQQRDQASVQEDGRRRRLETDEPLIQVVTIHKAKGLEYAVVLLPFASAARPVRKDDTPIQWHDETGCLHTSWTQASTDQILRADGERLAEDLRKLYVALTRAQHLLWIGVAPVQKQGPRAIDDLLGIAEETPQAYFDALVQLAQDAPWHQVTNLPIARQETLRNTSAKQKESKVDVAGSANGVARVPTRDRHDGWLVSSYSAMRQEAGEDGRVAQAATLPLDTPDTDNLQEMGTEALFVGVQAQLVPQEPLHRFPRGPEAGTFLHGLLEWAARQGFAQVVASPQAFDAELRRRSEAFGWTAWAPDLLLWLMAWMKASLPVGPTHLKLDLATQVKPELEFWMGVSHIDVSRVDTLVCKEFLAGLPRKPIVSQQLNGMLKGFIDLVVVHEGRYFVVDYKSNWLGPTDAHYSTEALATAVLEHRYELQYALYLLALHRLLRSRLPDYDYDAHIGGAAYLFLRGLHGPCAGVHFERPARGVIEALDQLFSGASETVS